MDQTDAGTGSGRAAKTDKAPSMWQANYTARIDWLINFGWDQSRKTIACGTAAATWPAATRATST